MADAKKTKKDIIRHYPPRWWDYDEMAYHLRRSVRYVKKLHLSGKIGAIRIDGNGNPLFNPDEINEFLMKYYQKSLEEKANDAVNDL
jgi:hypothetical protein